MLIVKSLLYPTKETLTSIKSILLFSNKLKVKETYYKYKSYKIFKPKEINVVLHLQGKESKKLSFKTKKPSILIKN